MQLLKKLLNSITLKISVLILIFFSGLTANAQTTTPVSATGSAGSAITGSAKATVATEGTMTMVGTAATKSDAYAVFNLATSGIPANAIVSAVTVTINYTLGTGVIPPLPISDTIRGTTINLSTVETGSPAATLFADCVTGTLLSGALSTATGGWGTASGAHIVTLPAAGITFIQNNLAGTISLSFATSTSDSRTYTVTGETGGASAPKLSVTYTVPATLTTSVSSLPAFSASACGTSAPDSFTVSGQFLSPASGNVVVTAPAGFLVSVNNIPPYTPTATIIYNSSTISAQKVYVEAAPTSGGPESGTITFSGGGAATLPTIAVSSFDSGLVVNNSVVNFSNVPVGIATAGMVDTLKGYNLIAGVDTVQSSNPAFQVSPDSITWSALYTFTPGTSLPATPVYIRLTAPSLGPVSGTVSISTQFGGTCPQSVSVSGTGTPPCASATAVTNTLYSNYSTSGVTATITPGAPTDGYIVVQSTVAPNGTGAPTNGVTYAVNASLYGGTVIANSTSPTVNVTGLAGNTTYYFSVFSYNGGPASACGGGPLYAAPLTTNATTCIGTPALLATTGLTSGGFTANWTAPASGGAFVVTYTVDVSTNNTFTAPVTGSPFTVTPPTTSLTLTGLNINTPYFYRVTAVTSNPNCTNTPSATGTVTTATCAAATWLGTTSSDWSNAANWSCNAVPNTTTAVTIPATAITMPSINSGTFTAASVLLAPGTTLAIAAGATLSLTAAIPLLDTGVISGAGTIVFNGTATQSYKGTGTINNLVINETAKINVSAIMNLTGVLTINNVVFTNNGTLVLVSNAAGTASIAAITGAGAISGVVNVQQYIPGGRRAFRFFGHPFNAAIALSQLQSSLDITGSGGSTNGFTTTGSNNPSAFWFNTLTGDTTTIGNNPGWTAFTNTTATSGVNAWNAKEGIRLLVRGTLGQGLDGNPSYTPGAVTLNMSGTVNTGAVTEPMTVVGTTSQFNLLSNPYPSPTDIGTVIANAGANVSGSGFWVWNAEMQTQGAYTVVPISPGYYLPANASFTVAAATAANLTFAETNKGAAATTALFKANSINNGITLHLYDSVMRSWDMVNVSFNSNAADSMENYDASHLHNPDLDFYSLSSNNRKLSIDARPYITGRTIPLGIATDVQQIYTIKAENFFLPAGEEVYLHDKYLNQYQQLQDGSQYTFSITSDPASQGNSRFELSMAGTATTGVNNVSGSNGLKVSMVPNPATEQVTITYEAPKSEQTSVRILNMAGQSVVNIELGNGQQGSVTIPLHNVATGMYMVELISGSHIVTQRLVKQ